jgi:tellurite resistance protein TerC
MDNLFVFIMIFAYFKVEPRYQHKVLMCGVLGALVMRGALIALGAQLVRQFAWILYGFGAFVLVTGLRMFFKKEEAKPGESLVLRTFSKLRRVTPEFHGEQFLARTDAGWMLTPLALTLVAIEVMDLMFAVDSIPAVFAVTRDPFIVYTSNICAILGLRSFYFLLAGLAGRLKHLHQGVAAVLVFIGMKMLLGGVVHIHNAISLLVVAVILLVSVVWSLGAKGPKEASPR